MPPFLSPSSGRSSRYRRRIRESTTPDNYSPTSSSSYYSSSAVAAAELAASSIIVSDTPSNKIANNNHHGLSVPKKLSSSSASTSSTVIQNLRASRARLMQRNMTQSREERWFKLKLICLGILFVIGLIWIGKRGNTVVDHQSYHSNKHHDVNNKQQQQLDRPKLSVPLPPNRLKGSSANDVRQETVFNLRHKKQSEDKHPSKISSVTDKNINTVNQDKSSLSNIDKSATLDNGVPQATHHHKHVIPPILTFTYHTNLLTTPTSQLSDSEDKSLAFNVQQITSLHPESKIRFLNDEDCLQSIQATLGTDTNLTTYFQNEQHGMYKADICRGAALYETGGLYFDIDVETRSIPLWDVIAPQTEFVTTLVHEDSNHVGNFFQAFIGVVPQHPIMKRYLELFVEYYEGRVKVQGPLGVYFLRMAYDEIYSNKKEEKEEKTELWQEVRYNPKDFPEIHRSRWGKRRACQMMVVAPPKSWRSGDGGGFERKKRMVPIFSHANGSRMCGGKDTLLRGNSDTA